LLTEHVLTLPGLGSLGITALKRRDFPLLQGFFLCAGGLYWLLRLLVDREGQAPNTVQLSPITPALRRRLMCNRQVIYRSIWGLLILLVLAAVAAQLAPYSPTEIHSHDQLLRPGYRYLLGTDFLGRDVLSRTLSGFRSTIPRVLLLTALTGGVAWLWLRLYRWFRGTFALIWQSGAALIEAFPALLLAWMMFLIVEPLPYPLEAALVLACLPSAGHLLSVQAPWSQQLLHLARLGERILVLDVLFFFLNLSPESLMPTWGSDIRHGMHYGHLNMWLVLAPTLAVVWSRYILYQLSLYDPSLVSTTVTHRTLEVDRA
jgi:ABC-type dipeptide/oligopeptide/nickel transport system permease subunit